uniref:BTB domain-containing protein n=1 Tax=Caenorhabditis tropicalis TaxID=1561998 RepID=A0A1I7TLT3_9PELO
MENPPDQNELDPSVVTMTLKVDQVFWGSRLLMPEKENELILTFRKDESNPQQPRLELVQLILDKTDTFETSVLEQIDITSVRYTPTPDIPRYPHVLIIHLNFSISYALFEKYFPKQFECFKRARELDYLNSPLFSEYLVFIINPNEILVERSTCPPIEQTWTNLVEGVGNNCACHQGKEIINYGFSDIGLPMTADDFELVKEELGLVAAETDIIYDRVKNLKLWKFELDPIVELAMEIVVTHLRKKNTNARRDAERGDPRKCNWELVRMIQSPNPI